MEQIRNIVFFGAGNVAWHFSKALARKGFSIIQVVNRSPEPGKELARLLGASYTPTVQEVTPDADLYVLAVSDTAIPLIAASFRTDRGIVVHTSGSVGLEALQLSSVRTGVFYPLQTFRKRKRIPFTHIPICVEASHPGVEKALLELAGSITSSVHVIDSEQRQVLHLAAVIAGNFTNYLYAVSEDLMTRYHIPFDLLKPLIRQTASNIRHSGLFDLQTGPAVREDREVIGKHLELLAGYEAYRELYDLITRHIIQHRYRDGKL